MGKRVEVKMAKATEEDFQSVIDFLNMLDEIMEYGTYTPPNEDEEEVSEEIDDAETLEWRPDVLAWLESQEQSAGTAKGS